MYGTTTPRYASQPIFLYHRITADPLCVRIMLTVREIHKRFGSIHAVQGVSFELHPGEVVGLLGPNGAGKSTTIRTVVGLVAPDSGMIHIDGIDALRNPLAARAKLGYLPESAPLYPEMSAQAYLMYRATLANLPRNQRKPSVLQAMERCRLTQVRTRRVGTLSKGYRQRVGLAAALLHNPPVLILDEPTDGLDPTQVQQTRALVQDSAQGRATLICSHVLSEVEKLCSRVLVIVAGRLVADGSPQSLIERHGGPPTYHTQVRADSKEVRQRLASIRGIERVQVPNTDQPQPWTHADAIAKPGAHDLREAIAEALAGLPIRELSVRQATLEGVFTALVESAATAESATTSPQSTSRSTAQPAERTTP